MPTLIYDGQCPLCTRAAEWVERRACSGSIELVPCQSKDRAARFPGISEEACMDAMQYVSVEGRVYSAEQALPHILALIPGWRWLVRLFGFPGIAFLAPSVYRWIARHRSALSIIVRHKGTASGSSCGPRDGCE
ncbi:MAG: DUF393 domain-containing protein [bacterium]|nr:DUF393 domain-containing protein [bacterium]